MPLSPVPCLVSPGCCAGSGMLFGISADGASTAQTYPSWNRQPMAHPRHRNTISGCSSIRKSCEPQSGHDSNGMASLGSGWVGGSMRAIVHSHSARISADRDPWP